MAGETPSENTRVVITISEWKRKIEAGEITPLNATNYKIVPDPDGQDYGVDTSVAERLTTMDLYNLVSKQINATNGNAGLRLETVFDNPTTEVSIVGSGNVSVTSDSTGRIIVASSGDSDGHVDDPDQIRTAMPMDLYKMSTSSHGHVHEVEQVTLGDGITMDNTNKIKHTNAITAGTASGSATATLTNGGSFQMPTVSYDAQGHVTGKGTTTMTLPTYNATNGIQITGGTLISHTNAVTAGTAKGSDTFTAENGDSFDIPTVTYDAQGHVTGKGTTTVTLPEFAADDGIEIDEDGLTFKHTNAIAAGTAEGTDTSTLDNGGSFTTPTVSYDAQGHVTGKGTHTITLPTYAADDGVKIDTDGLTFKHTNNVTAGTAKGSDTFTADNGDSFDIPTVSYDKHGHVTGKGTTTVTLPEFAAGDGIKIDTDGLTFKHTNNITAGTASGSATFTADNGDSFDIPTVSYDAHGHVTGKGTTTVTLPEFAAADGIEIDEDGLTFKHTNSITAGTAKGSDTFTADNGDSFDIPTVSYDAQGHVIATGSTTVTLPEFDADDGIKIDTDGLTFKHTNNITPDTASGSATFTADNGDSFDIPTVSYDKHGHVTAKGTTTVTLPTFAADDGIKIGTDGLTFKHTNNVTPGTAKGSEGVTIENGGTIDLPTVTWDKHGHVTGNASTTVTLPEYDATDGIEIDTDGLTFKHTNSITAGTASGSATKTLANGGSFNIPTVSYDAQGHVTGKGTTTITNPTFAAGDGIKIDTDGLTFKHTNAVTAGTAQGTATSTLANGGSFTTPTVTYDAQGHVTNKGTNTITLPTFKAGDGVKIDTDGLTFKHTNAITPGTAQGTGTSTIENGGSFTTPTVTWDAQGHVTGSGSNTITLPEYAATDGIEIDEDGLTFKHTNAITAGTASGSATKTLTNGASFNMPTVNYDAQGHITAKGTTTMTLPTFKAGDGVKIDTDGLTFKHTNAVTAGTAQGTATSTLTNGGSFTTPTVTYDAQGHVTAKGTNTITLPEYAADDGIEIDEDGLTFKHTNNVTAGTAAGSSTGTIGNGGSFQIPTVSYDKHGHVTTKGTTTITIPTFTANTGLKLNGLAFQHTNAVTAGTASGSATATLGNGGSFDIPTVTYDAQGHVTAKGTTTITLPTYTGSNGVTVSGTSITNSGVRSIATGTANGTISVNTNGTAANVAVKGLGSSAYLNITDTYSSTGTTPTSGKAVAQAIGTVTALMGSNNGIATLDASGKIPSSQMPGSYDDVLNYDTEEDFPETGEDNTIYVAKSTNTQYRWGGESYIPIGSHLALGETSSTAYRGDRGAVAYTHATDSARNTTAKSEALYAIGITAHGHVGSSTAITAGTGISLASNKISHTNSVTAGTASGSATATIGNGGSFSIPTVSYDAQGHITGKGTTTITIPTYAANTGIKLNGLTFQHTNAITAGTASGTATSTIGNGGSFSIPTVSYDAQGHITGKGTTTITIPTFAADGGIKIADDGLTFQHTNAITAGTASGSATKTLTFGDTFTIPTVSYDAQGHVTGKGTTTMTMPSLGTSATTAAYGNHTHATSIAASSGTNQLSLAANTKYALTAGGTSYIFTTPADTHWTSHLYAGASDGSANAATTNGNTYLIICDNSTVRDRRKIAGAGGTSVTSDADGNITITSPALGTGASNAAYGNHTHGITIAADSGTSAITLSPSTKYKLTAGGQSIIFTTPTDHTYTVNNGTLTIQGNGTSIGTFTANQSGASTINITPSNIGAATSGHTHDIALAADSGESAITLSPSTKYKLTAGGQSIIFTTPINSTYTVNNGTLTIQGNGTSLGTFTANQSSASTINITPSNIGAATSGHTHDISIAASSGTSSISLAANTKYQLTAGGKSYIFTTPADTNTWRPVGTGASDAAAGNHTHAISIATSTGTNQITLAHGGKYQITAGGQSYIFTMPADNNTTYSAGIGLSLSGTTFKTKLKSETALTNDSAAATETAGRIYPVALDKSGYLAVNVPWTDHTYTVNNGTLTIQGNGTSIGTFTANQSSASTINITPSNIGAAAASHGNHVPTTQTANNAIFLRNDNTWATVTPANIGAAASSHNHDSAYAAKSHTHEYLPLAGGALTGSVSIKETTSILLRTGNTQYTSGIGYDTNGNECIGIWAKNTVTRFRWHAGIDMSTMTAGKMMGITPDFEISKASGAAIGYIAGNTILTSGNYTSTITPASIGAAAASHGNHVPATQTANNAIFLRNDNTWQTVTPANIGAAATSHNHDSAYAPKTHNHTVSQISDLPTISDSATNSTLVKRTANGYIFATYLNQSSGAETPTTSSYIIYANSDGYLRKSSLANIKSILGLGSAAYTASTAYATASHNHDTVYTHKFHYGGTGDTTKIKIKINSTKAWMLSFIVNLYQGYRATSVLVSGYQYGSSYWYSPTAVILGDSSNSSIKVYFGYDSTNNLWVGFDGGNYTGVSISNVTNGYTQIDNFAGLFTISNVSSLTTLQTTITAQPPSLNGHTHGIALAADSGTSAITLSPSTKYKLTAGGQSIIFTTPTDHTYTVNNGTLTIQGNGTSLGTFTANQSGASTINITPANIGAAAASHGNHVPATQTANNAVFLRNDNTWQTVTPANIGAAASSHNHDSAYAAKSHTHNYAGSASAGGPATNVVGTYSGNGGQLTPSAVGSATVRFVMMNNPKGLSGFPTYADCLLMDTYSGSDVPWSTGLGIVKQDAAPRMFLFNGAKGNTTTWKNINEVLTTSNYSSYAATSGHNHDSVYAAKSHGNHVPATQTANNAIFLRNDNTWATVTPANIGAAATSHNHDSAYAAKSHTHNYAGSSSAGGAANSLAGLTLSTTTNINIDNTTVTQQIGYVSGLTKAAWNSQQTDGALYKQTYSAAWAHMIFGDYRTGHMAVRGRNNGSFSTWLNVLDSGNYTTWVTPANIGAATSGHNHDSAYAAKSHTHTTSLASGGTATVNLAANTAYTLTAGGTSVVFKTPADNNTTYSAGTGISLSGTTFSNSGVRSISTGSSNGTISVNTNGTAANVAVKGLGSAAYTASTAYAAASHDHHSTAYGTQALRHLASGTAAATTTNCPSGAWYGYHS